VLMQGCTNAAALAQFRKLTAFGGHDVVLADPEGNELNKSVNPSGDSSVARHRVAVLAEAGLQGGQRVS
jgi:H2-forming N5,N10-methylenetetrahydromethanopterin dehydrogenase-like enzyme